MMLTLVSDTFHVILHDVNLNEWYLINTLPAAALLLIFQLHVLHAVPGSLSNRLKELEAQNLKKCDNDVGGCDRPDTPFRQLLNQPSVFTLQMAWEEQVSGEDIKDTLEVVDTEVRC
jgi:hypothetical protein